MLHYIFNPRSIAIVGASENPLKMGNHVLVSLIEGGYAGKIYPVNPKYDYLLNLKAYPSVETIPDQVDLTVVIVPREQVVQVMEECGRKGVKGAIVIGAGFREAYLCDGDKYHNELAKVTKKYGIKVIGPNTFGVVNLHASLNASFTPAFSKLKAGNIALVAQSGGVCHTIMPYALKYGIGFSKVLSIGNRLNVDFPEMLDYLLTDEDTRSIAIYVEGVDDPRRLMDAARRVVPHKPIVVYKVGRFSKADVASLSHTGSLAGDYMLYDAAFRQVGIIQADDCIELVSMAKALAYQPPARGNRVAVISLTAGPGMILAETCERMGLKLAEFSYKTKSRIDEIVPPMTMRHNPVDLGLLAAEGEKSGEVIKAVFEDECVDAVVIGYLYSWYGDFLKVPVQEVIECHKAHGKPVSVCLAYPEGVWDHLMKTLEENSIPTFPTNELAAKAIWSLVEYGRILRHKYGVSLG